MILTYKQEQGLKIAVDRYRAKEKYTVISGYAGTGKSTLIKFIIEALGIDEAYVAYATFTGKAAQVLSNKGNKNAMTLHKLLYEHTPLPDGTFIQKAKKEIEYSLIIVDEISMVPKSMVELLFSHRNVHVICLGDPFQIPPINTAEDNHLLDNPHIFLDEIMRQAADSGIIQLSMKIRNREPINGFTSNDAKVVPANQFVDGMITWADIILCSTNKMRKAINEQARSLLGYTEPLVNGEKIICCRNYWNKVSENKNALVNGCVGYLDNFSYDNTTVPKYLKVSNNKIPIIKGEFVTEFDDNFNKIKIDKNYFLSETNFLTPQQSYQLSRNIRTKNLIPYEFTYAYAITGHRAQGSQWDKVMVVEEAFPFGAEEHARWLYTCVTRSVNQCAVITKE